MSTRKYWIEVTGGDLAWLDKMHPVGDPRKRGLKAPARAMYLSFFKRISPEDLVFTYLTRKITQEKEWQSSFVGISVIADVYHRVGNTILIDTRDDIQLPVPVKLSEVRTIQGHSFLLSKAIAKSMQAYLFEITKADCENLLSHHEENQHLLEQIEHWDS